LTPGRKELVKMDNDIYRRLQEHLDKMPVGYPATASGVELRLLRFLFTPEQARIALRLDPKFRTVEEIHEGAKDLGISRGEFEKKLEEMVDRGTILSRKQDGVKRYANVPFVVGMMEFQHPRATEDFLRDTGQYFQEGFAAELLALKIPQTRVIPVRKSIDTAHRIGTYDELRSVIENAEGRIRVGKCACRVSTQKAGNPCKVTKRDETCMAFREFADAFGRTGWGRPIDKEEALQIAARNEEDGLILQPGNQQEVQFMCSCCGDCCGVLRLLKSMPRPADFVASNYYAQANPDLCEGCGTCVSRCQMEAVSLKDGVASVDIARCVGCGLCVPTCNSASIQLVKKKQELVPPKGLEEMYEALSAPKRVGPQGP
jgi:Pyruvate/2-oxoacid:ferredoxin oxidoreductase delta subunit